MVLVKMGSAIDDRWNVEFVIVVSDVVVVVVHVVAASRNLSLMFGLIGVKSSYWWRWVPGGGGGVKSFSCQTQLLLF